jgi:hypothetical protein
VLAAIRKQLHSDRKNMDIFTEKRLHPGQDNPINLHYKNYFDTVYIAFSPFFKIKQGNFTKEGRQKSRQITFEQAQAENEIFQKMPKPAADIYSYDNANYPDDEEIYLNAEQVSWKDIKEGCEFESYGDINKALKTSIGAYKKVFQKIGLAKRLSDFTAANQIYHPTEGHFEILSKREIFKAFHLLNKTELNLEEEFCLTKKELNIASITERKFVDAVNFKDYFIYDVGKEILFAIDWDDFFFLICSSKQHVDTIVSQLNFEGFYCDDVTEVAWELTREEIEAGVQKEKQEAVSEQGTKPVDKKPWWKLW